MDLAASCDSGIDFLGMFADPIGTMIEMVAKIVMQGAIGVFESVGDIKSHDKASSNVINRQTQWIVVYLAIGSILFAAAKMALDRRGDAGQTALKGILRVTLVSTASSTVIITFATLMDRYSDHLFRNSLKNLMHGIDCSGSIPNMLLLVVGCLLLLSGIIHALLMWIRLGVMIVLMGTLPMAAAASMTDWGSTWWRKHLGWLIAWLLYKPTVSLVLYSGSVMIDTADNSDQIDTQIAGMGLLLLSAVALPALMRVIVPATAALGGDSVGSATMAVAGGVASGAKSLADAAGRNGAGGPSGASGPSGAGGGGSSASGGQGGEGRAGANGQSGPSGWSGSGGSGGSSGAGGPSGSSGAGGPGGSSGAGAAGGSRAAAAANPALAALVVASETAGKVAKGAVNVAKSGVEGAGQGDGH
jgi:hypothetical protein